MRFVNYYDYTDRFEKAGLITHSENLPIYKYTTIEAAINILSNCNLRFSSIKSFNDPFELNDSLINWNFKLSDLKKELVYSIQQAKPEVSEKQILMFLNTLSRDEHLQNAKNSLAKMKGETQVCCLSEKMNNTLMWSHYADRHSGICIGFKLPRFQKKYIMNLFKVHYTNDVIPYKILSGDVVEASIAYFMWCFTKSKDWEYENEVRAIIPAGIVETDKSYSFIPIEPSQIVEIYYGVATTESDINKIETIIKEKRYNIQNKGKMGTNNDKFKLSLLSKL